MNNVITLKPTHTGPQIRFIKISLTTLTLVNGFGWILSGCCFWFCRKFSRFKKHILQLTIDIQSRFGGQICFFLT